MATHRSGSTSKWTGWPNCSSSNWCTKGVRLAPSDEDHFVDLVGVELGVGKRFIDAAERLGQQRPDQVFVLRAADLPPQVERSALLLRDELLFDRGGRFRGEPFLASSTARSTRNLAASDFRRSTPWSLRKSPQTRSRSNWSKSSPPRCVSPWLLSTSTTLRSICTIENVERPAAQIVDQQAFHLVGMRVVGERGGGRLIDDPHDFQARQLTRFASHLALRLIEEGGNGDDRFAHGIAKLLLGEDLSFRRMKEEISWGEYSLSPSRTVSAEPMRR